MEDGFTLIEILIVIAVIGLLIVALMFNAAAALKSGRITSAKNHGSEVSLTATQWLSQNVTRKADVLNGTDCTQATTLTQSGPVAGFTEGSLGWDVPKTVMVCTIQGHDRNLQVITSSDGQTFTNGETP